MSVWVWDVRSLVFWSFRAQGLGWGVGMPLQFCRFAEPPIFNSRWNLWQKPEFNFSIGPNMFEPRQL